MEPREFPDSQKNTKDTQSENREASISDPSYLFEDLAIAPALDEFARLYEKKVRSFDSGQGSGLAEAYRKAYELGEKMIRRHVATDEGDSRC